MRLFYFSLQLLDDHSIFADSFAKPAHCLKLTSNQCWRLPFQYHLKFKNYNLDFHSAFYNY